MVIVTLNEYANYFAVAHTVKPKMKNVLRRGVEAPSGELIDVGVSTYH